MLELVRHSRSLIGFLDPSLVLSGGYTLNVGNMGEGVPLILHYDDPTSHDELYAHHLSNHHRHRPYHALISRDA